MDDLDDQLSIDFFDNQSFQGEEIPEPMEDQDDIKVIQSLLDQDPDPVPNPEQNLEHVKNQVAANLKKVVRHDKSLLTVDET